jgi:hypothetical protein
VCVSPAAAVALQYGCLLGLTDGRDHGPVRRKKAAERVVGGGGPKAKSFAGEKKRFAVRKV